MSGRSGRSVEKPTGSGHEWIQRVKSEQSHGMKRGQTRPVVNLAREGRRAWLNALDVSMVGEMLSMKNMQ